MDKRLSEQEHRLPSGEQAMHERLRCKCQGMSQQIETAVVNVGRIITDLRPSILDHQGLWAAMEWQAHEFAHSAELSLEWTIQGVAAVDLPEHLATAVDRLARLVVGNIRIDFTPGQWEHLAHRAEKMGLTMSALDQRMNGKDGFMEAIKMADGMVAAKQEKIAKELARHTDTGTADAVVGAGVRSIELVLQPLRSTRRQGPVRGQHDPGAGALRPHRCRRPA